MTKVDITKDCWQKSAIKSDGPVCLVIRAALEPVAGLARFQPAGFPEIGHVIYEAPRDGGRREKVCIVDSPASMANHLESVCLNGLDNELHPELAGMPYVRCVTDRGDSPSANQQPDRVVCTSLTEGHRIASDYFLEGLVSREWVPERKKSKKNGETVDPAHWTGTAFRDQLRKEFGIKEVKRDKTYFIWPEAWWNIYTTLFKYDPNSLLHGVMFAREQIKLYRILTAHLEATGAARVGTSGVKFDRLGKTTSGQPIFAVDEETAQSIMATFVLDLALLRSYGCNGKGLNDSQKKFLLDLAAWKVKRLLVSPFRFRTGCHLVCTGIGFCDETDRPMVPAALDKNPADIRVEIQRSLLACGFSNGTAITDVYYPSERLFKAGDESGAGSEEETTEAESSEIEDEGD